MTSTPLSASPCSARAAATRWLLTLAAALWLALAGPLPAWSSPALLAGEQQDEEQEEEPAPTPPSPTPTATPAPSPSPSPSPTAEPVEPAVPTAQPDQTGPPLPEKLLADYPLLQGHFYSQTVPGARPGFGFSVADAGGIPLWREYQRLGGLAKLGYPLSRRFVHDGTVVQAFQGGVLQWRPERDEAIVLPLARLVPLPAQAVEPEPPHRLGATAARQPWSGWWWPATRQVRGPYLFDLEGPLAKYDRFVAASGGGDPATLDWEREQHGWVGLSWAGHCNGWAAAALLEDEPTQPRELAGITFGVDDLKGLLAAYHFADAAAWLDGGPDDSISPLDLHRRLLNWLGRDRKGFVLTFRPGRGEEVWSYPAYRFELTLSPDPENPDATHARALVWLADNDVPADFVGLQPWRGEPQVYEYRLFGPREAPTGGEWLGASAGGGFARPAQLWYPEPRVRNLERELASPNLDYQTLKRILRGP